MKSIRRRLTISLLGGLVLLLVLAGTGIYFSVQSGLLKAVDAELAIDAQMLRFVVRGNDPDSGQSVGGKGRDKVRRLQGRIPAYDEVGSGFFYQGWTREGEAADRSTSLGDRELPFPGQSGSEPVFATTHINDGAAVRTMSFRIPPGGKGRPKGERRRAENATTITIARELESMEQTLQTLLGGIVIVGLLAVGGAILLVGAALKRGLKPLRELGAQAREIGASSLDGRFDAAEAPAELQPIYQRLNGLMERLENSFERERRFSSDLAHEMRTPVAELKLMSENALQWPEEAGRKTHEESLEIAEQLESMIENLLTLARWESAEAPLKSEAVNLEAAARECWETFSGAAEAKQLKVRIAFEEEAGDFVTDPEMLRHILNNLLSNAVEYTPESGEITVTGDSAGIEIANTVDGVHEADVDRFFDRYWRKDRVRGDSGHAGLGLSLAKACAEALGLQLSAKLEGSRVRFSLGEGEKIQAT